MSVIASTHGTKIVGLGSYFLFLLSYMLGFLGNAIRAIFTLQNTSLPFSAWCRLTSQTNLTVNWLETKITQNLIV